MTNILMSSEAHMLFVSIKQCKHCKPSINPSILLPTIVASTNLSIHQAVIFFFYRLLKQKRSPDSPTIRFSRRHFGTWPSFHIFQPLPRQNSERNQGSDLPEGVVKRTPGDQILCDFEHLICKRRWVIEITRDWLDS